MDIKYLDRMDKINNYVAFLFVVFSIIYTTLTTEHTITYDDYTFAPIMVKLLVILITYVFYTIVKSNRLIDFNLGIIAIIILQAFVPIIGSEYDPMGTTAQYYKIMAYIVLVGIVYITAFKIIKYAASAGIGDVKRGI